MHTKLQKIGGKYVIAIHGYKDTQYGEADYPTNWFVSKKRYTLGYHTDKIRKFNSYEEAEKYIRFRQPKYTKNRSFEIIYLTGRWWENDKELNIFYGLEKGIPEDIDRILIDKEISGVKLRIKTYEDMLSELSNRAIKRREKYHEIISSFKKNINTLNQAKLQLKQSGLRVK